MTNNKVLVVGESCDDIFIYGSAKRLCPDVPAPVFKSRRRNVTKGMAGNTVRNLESLGIKTDLIKQRSEITKTRYVDEKLNYTFIRVDEGESNIDRFSNSEITNEEISEYKAVVISDYGKGFLSESDIERFCKNNANTFLDTKKLLGDYCKEVKIIKINEPEFDIIKNYTQLDNWRNKLIVTLGDRGCMFNKEKGFSYYPADKVDIFDLSGAGDTFLAAVSYAFTTTKNIEDSILFAQDCCQQVISKKGIVTI